MHGPAKANFQLSFAKRILEKFWPWQLLELKYTTGQDDTFKI